MPAAMERRWTAAEVRALPDEEGKHYEVIDGELFVSPGPSFVHQRVVLELTTLLSQYVREHRAGDILNGPAEIEPDAHTLVQPDIFIVPLVDGRRPKDWDAVRRLILAVEVLSPSSSRKDRVRKRDKYLSIGAEYWIVDPAARLVERWVPGDKRPEILVETVVWSAPDATKDLRIDLEALFARAIDD